MSPRTITTRVISRFAIGLALHGLSACTSEARATQPVGCSSAAIVYGNDDRKEAWEADPPWADLATSFVVAVAEKWTVELLAAGQLSVHDLETRYTMQVCADEPFADQPSLAACSGVLLAPDLVLTAAHCVDGEDDCESLVYMAQFANQRESPWGGVRPESLRACKSIARIDSADDPSGTALDVALVQLDRGFDVSDAWFSIRADEPRIGERLVAIGHPSGLPLKLDDGGKVLSSPHDVDGYITADIDAFQGLSGGPVFDAEGALLGVVLGGGPDQSLDRADGCLRVRRIGRAKKELAERVAPVAEALKALCSSGSERACELHRSAAAVAPQHAFGCEPAH